MFKISWRLFMFTTCSNMSPIYIPTTPDQLPVINFFAMPSGLNLLNNSFSQLGVRLWNALTETIRKLKNKKVFRNQMHDEMLINILRTENLYLSTFAIIDIIKNL